MKNLRKKLQFTAFALIAFTLAGCEHNRPKFTSIQDSIGNGTGGQMISTPVSIARAPKPAPGSLWQPGNKQFFKDSRANKVGDIVTIIVSEKAEAETEATTETTRTNDSKSTLSNLLNLEGKLLSRGIPITANNLLNTDSNRKYTGEGKTDRKDKLTAKVAAVVTQVLPNGYLVIQGRREVVVNYELQEMQIQGIVRPEDISAMNTVPSDKIAEARIFYAGKGVVDETQTPQYGVRFLDKVLPF